MDLECVLRCVVSSEVSHREACTQRMTPTPEGEGAAGHPLSAAL